MGWLIALGVLILLGCLPLGVSAIYNADGAIAKLIAGPIRIMLYPWEKKEKEKHAKDEKPKESPKQAVAPKEEKKGGSFTDFLPLFKVATDFLRDFRRKIRIKRLEMLLCMAGGDPCDLGINYGRAWAAVGNLMPQLERLFVIKKRSVEAQCDFTADITRITARLDLTITLGRLLGLVCVYGVKLLRQYFTIMKIRKGGAKT